jgi:hypothetical protein
VFGVEALPGHPVRQHPSSHTRTLAHHHRRSCCCWTQSRAAPLKLLDIGNNSLGAASAAPLARLLLSKADSLQVSHHSVEPSWRGR